MPWPLPSCPLLTQVQMHAYVGAEGIHVGALAAVSAKTIGNGVLHFQRGVVGVADGARAPGHFDGKGVSNIKDIRPVMRVRGGVEGVVAAADIKGADGQEHAGGQARP